MNWLELLVIKLFITQANTLHKAFKGLSEGSFLILVIVRQDLYIMNARKPLRESF